MTAPDTDQQLVQRAQRGDLRAFDLLVLKYQGRIAALVSRYVSDAGEVEDVTQEAFIKAYRALGKFRGDSAFYTWLYRIAANAAKNHLVAKGRRPGADATIEDAEGFDEGGLLSEIASPEALAMGSELAEVVIVKDGGCVEFNVDSIRDGDTGGRQMSPSVVNQRPVDRLRRITGRTTGVFQRCKPFGYRYLDNCYSFCKWHQIEDESFELEGVG